jgi:hypothetical protein
MNPVVSYLDLVGKLLLLLGISLNSIAILQKSQKGFPDFSFTIFSLFPFFLVYKIVTALGKGSLSGWLYLGVAIALNIIFLSQFLNKNNRLNELLKFLLKIVRTHHWFIIILTGIFIFVCSREIYLEYPSDAVIYFQRVGIANQDAPINFGSLWNYDALNTFFFSFQQWLVGSDSWFRDQLTLIAAISVSLLCIATYRLAFWCTQSTTNSIIAVCLSLAFYGNLQINFYLYKILQGATLAMIVYLESIPILWRFLSAEKIDDSLSRKRVYEIGFLAAAFWICLDCHQEKILYFFAILFSFSMLTVIKTSLDRKKPPRSIVFIFTAISAISLILFFLPKAPVSIHPPLIARWFLIGEIDVFTFWPVPPNSAYILLDMVCLGLIFLLFTVADVHSKYFFMAAIAFSPLLFFLNPIIISGLLKLTYSQNIYRLMLGGIPWIFLPISCHYLSQKKGLNLRYLPVLFLLLGFLAYSPIFGKYPHLFMQVPGYANGKDLTPVIDHLLEYSYEHNNQDLKILGEPYTNSYLTAWPQFRVQSNRWLDSNPELYGPGLSYVFSNAISEEEIAAILVQEQYEFIVLNRRDNLDYQSWLGRMTAHWPPTIIQDHRTLFSGDALNQYLLNHPDEYQQILIRNDFHVYHRKS